MESLKKLTSIFKALEPGCGKDCSPYGESEEIIRFTEKSLGLTFPPVFRRYLRNHVPSNPCDPGLVEWLGLSNIVGRCIWSDDGSSVHSVGFIVFAITSADFYAVDCATDAVFEMGHGCACGYELADGKGGGQRISAKGIYDYGFEQWKDIEDFASSICDKWFKRCAKRRLSKPAVRRLLEGLEN